VLSEDEYTAALERIIARDYFPTLELRQQRSQRSLNAQHDDEVDEDVEASVARIREWMEETPGRGRQRQSQQVRPSMDKTPTDFHVQATPAGYTSRTDRRDTQSAKEQQQQLPFEANLSLDEFQARYTSEDNASFAALLEVENIARKSKYAWAYKAEADANDKARRAIQARERLVDLGRRLAEGDSEVRLIEGTEPGRPGERLLIEGRQSLPGDKASIEFAKRRIVAAPAKERLLIEAGKEGQDTQSNGEGTDEPAEREKQLQLAVQENKLEVDLQRNESRDAGKVQTWPVTVSIA
jgi:protein DGCR14